MTEIIRINLDNELDLILAHKRAMKLAELCGLISSAQTRFATAVSEIARCSISFGKNSRLTLGINFLNGGKKEIIAIILDTVDLEKCSPESFAYAGRLSKSIHKAKLDDAYEIMLTVPIQYGGTITAARIDSFNEYFKIEAPLSPYDEIRKKNIQLIELSEKLIDSENNYRQLTDTLPLIVFSMTTSGTITLSNQKAVDWLGKQFKTFNSTSLHSLLHIDDQPTIVRDWETSRSKEIPYNGQVRIFINGDYLWHLMSILPNKNDDGKTGSWIVAMVDIHAQKLIEETLKDNKELREAQKNLKASNEELLRKNSELEQFAYVASHDLQEPLRKIRNFISLAERSNSKDEIMAANLDKIGIAAERMSFLVKDILNYSVLTTAKDQFEKTDLNFTLHEVLQDLELSVSDKKAKITIDSLPTINAIPIQMSQLFYNLLSNALKFSTDNPKIQVSCLRLPKGTISNGFSADQKSFCISVEDNGIGIEEQYLKKIFSIFQRLHNHSSYSGTGIGLSLCKRIVENHNGRIMVESVPGKGSIFKVYLPLQ